MAEGKLDNIGLAKAVTEPDTDLQQKEDFIKYFIESQNPSAEEIVKARKSLGMPIDYLASAKALAKSAAVDYGIPALDIIGNAARPLVDVPKAALYNMPAYIYEAAQKEGVTAGDAVSNTVKNLARSATYGPLNALQKAVNFSQGKEATPEEEQSFRNTFQPEGFKELEARTGILKDLGVPENINFKNYFSGDADAAEKEAFIEHLKSNKDFSPEDIKKARASLGLDIEVPTTTALDIGTDLITGPGVIKPITGAVRALEKIPFAGRAVEAVAEPLFSGVSKGVGKVTKQIERLPLKTGKIATAIPKLYLGGGVSDAIGSLSEKAYQAAAGLNAGDLAKISKDVNPGKLIRKSGIINMGTGAQGVAEKSAEQLLNSQAAIINSLAKLDAQAAPISKAEIAAELAKKAASQASKGRVKTSSGLSNIAGDIANNPLIPDNAPLSFWHNFKTDIKSTNQYQPGAYSKNVNNQTERLIDKVIKSRAMRAGTEATNEFMNAQKPYHAWSVIKKAATRRANQIAQQPIGGMLDRLGIIGGFGTGYSSGSNEGGGGFMSGLKGAILAPVALRVLTNRGAGAIANTLGATQHAVNFMPVLGAQSRIEDAKYKLLDR